MLMKMLSVMCIGLTAAAALGADLPAFSQLPAKPELPDPLVAMDGRKIETKLAWEQERRPELKRLFQHYMYGAMPAAGRTRGEVLREDRQALVGKATLREITVYAGPDGSLRIPVLLLIPNARKGPAPVFVGINFAGNHTVIDDPKVPISGAWFRNNPPAVVDNRATEAGRGSQKDVWNAELIIDRGYALASFCYADVEPDDNTQAQRLRQGASEETGSIMRWAWGFSRVIDFLVRDRDLDRKRIAAVGHSRNGKAAIVAAAFDERIALAIPNQAGCGGTAPSRGTVGESVKRINTSFPHWFNARFKEFNDEPQRLPFDQHSLLALVAPRPVLFSNAVEDTWANPAGQFEVLKAASPVYKLLGVEGVGAETMPAEGKLLNSRLGYFIRPGKHSMSRVDWQAYLDFADRHLVGKGKV